MADLTAEEHEWLNVRTNLVSASLGWQRIEPRVKRDFEEAFEVSQEASIVTRRYLDAVYAEGSGHGDALSAEEIVQQGRVADQLDDFAQVAGAIVILVVDEYLRRVYKALKVPYGTTSGPPVGVAVHAGKVAFSDLVHAGANSFRHIHEWEDLNFNHITHEYERGAASQETFKAANRSLPILRRALGSYSEPFRGFQTLEVLRALAMNEDTYRTDWQQFRMRLLTTVQDVVCRVAGCTPHYNFLCEYLPGVGYPTVG